MSLVTGMVGYIHVHNPNTWEAELEESGLQGQSHLHTEFKASLCY